MNKQQILNHFHNGDVVECVATKREVIFRDDRLSIVDDCWVIKIPFSFDYFVIESNGKLATIIQHDKTEVYVQLGKEIEVILKANPNDSDAGSKIRKLYGL